jgi:hypothetical protein
MNEPNNRDDGSLVPAVGSDLAPIASTNLLVLRGIADLAKLRDKAPGECHPFDALSSQSYRALGRLLGIRLRLRQLPGMGADSLRLSQPYSVKPQDNPEKLPRPGEQLDEDE